MWVKEPKGTAAEHWVDLVEEPDEDGNYWARASVKWDGCIHFNRLYNVPANVAESYSERNPKHPEMVDYIHICDLDGMIESLQALKAAALAHFGEDWPR